MILGLMLAGATVPAAEKTPAAARAVVVRYYDAIEHGRYREAYRLWSGDGEASGKSYPAFVRGFAGTAHSHVVAGKAGDGDGAAGSVFVTVPVTVHAQAKNGVRQRFVGSYTLRRVNDVDGATAAQLRWHISSAKLKKA